MVRHGQLVAEWNWNGTEPSTARTSSRHQVRHQHARRHRGVRRRPRARRARRRPHPGLGGHAGGGRDGGDLLSGDSGRHWDPVTDYLGLSAAADQDAFATGLAQDSAPGTTWVYNNAAIQDLDAVLRDATGQGTAAFAQARLLGPIGMADSR